MRTPSTRYRLVSAIQETMGDPVFASGRLINRTQQSAKLLSKANTNVLFVWWISLRSFVLAEQRLSSSAPSLIRRGLMKCQRRTVMREPWNKTLTFLMKRIRVVRVQLKKRGGVTVTDNNIFSHTHTVTRGEDIPGSNQHKTKR